MLVVTQRDRADGYGRQPAYTAFIEAEDVLAGCCDVDVFPVVDGLFHPRIRVRRIGGRLMRRFGDSGLEFPSISGGGVAEHDLRDHYDLLVFVGFTVWDLPLLERLSELRKRAGHVVAWFPEAWLSAFDGNRVLHEPFSILDTLVVGMASAARRFDAELPIPVHYVPPTVDVRKFAAIDPFLPRPIDVLGIGRRIPQLHQALLDWSHKAKKLYVYDTTSGNRVGDTAAHRSNLGDTYRNTNIALSSYAKFDQPAVTRGDREIPGRVWEGLASGALMLGLTPSTELQREVIGEPVVIDMPTTAGQAVELIDELQREDHEASRRAHVQLALRGHDWSHRWSQIFAACGVSPGSRLEARIDQLEALASSL
ncbi:MAG: glycosyltransferase [Actinomycetota bacterium]